MNLFSRNSNTQTVPPNELVQSNQTNELDVVSADIKFKQTVSMCLVGLTAGQIILVFTLIGLVVNNKKLATTSHTFVQNSDGSAILVTEKDGNYRSPQLIKRFVNEWISLTFNWDGKISGTNQEDPGMKTENNGKVPANAWAAAVMMEPQFGQSFLNQLSEIIPGEIYGGKLTSTAYVRHISEPRQTSPSTWSVDVVATRTFYDHSQRKQTDVIAFNRTFTIAAVAIPRSPLTDDANTVEKTIYKMRTYGLEIRDLTEFQTPR